MSKKQAGSLPKETGTRLREVKGKGKAPDPPVCSYKRDSDEDTENESRIPQKVEYLIVDDLIPTNTLQAIPSLAWEAIEIEVKTTWK